MTPKGQQPAALLTTDEDGLPLRCQGAGLVDSDKPVFDACESKSTDARMLVYEGWCLWFPLCEAHTALFDADIAANLEAV